VANSAEPDIDETLSGRTAALRVLAALLVAAPAVVLRVSGVALAPPLAVVVFGAAVLASVALLMWAAEAARADISGSLALALLALVAILPEYAVDIFFAYSAGSRPEYAAFATQHDRRQPAAHRGGLATAGVRRDLGAAPPRSRESRHSR